MWVKKDYFEHKISILWVKEIILLQNNKIWKEAHLLMSSLDGNVT